MDTSFFKGEVGAVCMADPIHDLMIGNMPQSNMFPYQEWKKDELQMSAVITRAQGENAEKPIRVNVRNMKRKYKTDSSLKTI